MDRSKKFFVWPSVLLHRHGLKGKSVWTTMKPIPDQRRPTGSECSLKELQDKQGKVKAIGGGQ